MGKSAQAIIRSEIFAIIARCCMVLASVTLPAIGGGAAWLGQRLIAQGDQLIADVAELKTQEKLNAQAIKFVKETGEHGLANARETLSSQDLRIRGLEAELRSQPLRRN
jgi:hypothetical protein